MLRLISLFFLSVLLFINPSFADAPENSPKFTISGYIKDSETGEMLVSANVFIKELSKGAQTNQYGFYSITLPAGSYSLTCSYIGYENKVLQIKLEKNQSLNIEMKPTILQTKEVEIIGRGKTANVTSTDVGKVELPMEKAKSIPAILGEVDILKTIQLLPGIQSAGEGSTGFYVRGGGADQNLILLDEAIVFNTGHLFGFFSVFNSDAIKNTTLIKGGMPANYGGRLSSVVDVSMKDGNTKTYHATGGIGLISSRLTVEGPLKKNNSSFMVSGRRTYIDFLMKPFIVNTKFEGNGYHFYDLNVKMNHKFSDKDRLFLSGYFGRDIFNYHSTSSAMNIQIPWGNATSTIRWNHLFSEKLFLNTSAIYNDYNFEFNFDDQNFKAKMYSGIKDVNLKLDFGYFPGLLHKIKFGANYTYHTFIPGSASATTSDGADFSTEDIKKKYAHETAIYLLDNFDLTEKIALEAGIRLSSFTIVPPYTELITDSVGEPLDTVYFHHGEGNNSYYGYEPRINLRWTLTENSSIKASYNHNYQYIHLVSNSTSTLPTDIWVPSTKIVKPQIGDQYSIGYFRNFRKNTLEASVEVYFKALKNQIEYRDGYIMELNRELEWDFVFGKGYSYGAEFFLNKKTGKLTGWVGYTYSKTLRHFDDLATTDFPAKFDRTHDISVVAIYQPSKKLNFGATFVFGSGNVTTLPERRYFIENKLVNEYGPRNSYRIQPYHRADVSVTWNPEHKKRKIDDEWVFSVYNVYNRKNVFFIYINTEGNPLSGDLTLKARKVSLFPAIPSITWNFKF